MPTSLPLYDLAVVLPNQPGSLATLGETLGRAGISLEGGGAWVADGRGWAHFLVAEGEPARLALSAAGFEVAAVREVICVRLNQDEPGQLGKFTRRLAEAGVNIEVQYSDHDHQLIVVVDDVARGQAVAAEWMRERAERLAARKQHRYAAGVEWSGNDGEGTKSYRSYRRDHTITVDGKPPILGSSDVAFRGDPARHTPEDLLVASLAACHMLWYLHLCAVNGIVVIEYRDRATGEMAEAPNGAGAFTRVVLHPGVTIAPGGDLAKAHALHAEAHANCFIARSVNFPVDIAPEPVTCAAGVAPGKGPA